MTAGLIGAALSGATLLALTVCGWISCRHDRIIGDDRADR